MTYAEDRGSDDAIQGQQDDYFNRDLAIAGHKLPGSQKTNDQAIKDYQDQGQQDDYFDQDLAIAGHELRENSQDNHQEIEDYQGQGQQDDYFEQDLSQSSGTHP